MDCLHCGHSNPAHALYCSQCGEVLKHETTQSANEELIGPSYAAMPTEDLLRRSAARARRFLLLIVSMLVLPVLCAAALWQAERYGGNSGVLAFHHSALRLGVWFYAVLIYAFLTAKTGQALGLPWLVHFTLALIPPLTPAVWARIGGRPVWRPYVYFLIDAAVLGGGFYCLQNQWPYLLLVLGFCMIPFLVYQLFGCAVGPIAYAAGLYPSAVVGWLCLGPTLLLGVLLWEFFAATGLSWNVDPLIMSLADFKALLLTPHVARDFPILKNSIILYGLVTVIIWIKVVYEDLKLPQV